VPLNLFDSCFVWINERWGVRKEEAVEKIRVALRDASFDLARVKAVDLATWKELGLGVGYRERVVEAVTRWLHHRSRSSRRRRGSLPARSESQAG